jgi:hypothetical protein
VRGAVDAQRRPPGVRPAGRKQYIEDELRPRCGSCAAQCETERMPVLEPNPPQSQRRLLIIFGLMLGVPALVAVVATFAARMG